MVFGDPDNFNVALHLHSGGVNMRYIGNIIDYFCKTHNLKDLKNRKLAKQSSFFSSSGTPLSSSNAQQGSSFRTLIRTTTDHFSRTPSFDKSMSEDDQQGQGQGQRTKDFESLVLLLLAEGIARVIKNELNRQLREKVRELKLPQEVLFSFS